MNKEFIPYEQALELKELGFDESCLRNWKWSAPERKHYLSDEWHPTTGKYVGAPLYQQAFRWFREKYELNQTIGVTVSERLFIYIVEDISTKETRQTFNPSFMGRYKIYEEAELACLKKLIEIVKNK